MNPRSPRVPRRRGRLAVLLLATLPFPAGAQEAPEPLTLRTALDSALASHPSVLAADARVDAAEAGRRQARAQLLPTVAASGSLARFQEPMVVAPLHGFDPTNPPTFDRTLIQGQVGLEYTLFDGGARDATIRTAEASEVATTFRRDATTMELLEAVTTAYTGVLSAREVQEAASRQVAALEAEHTHAQQRLDEGTAARVEVLRAQAALLDARAQEATADARAGLAERHLARLMGLPATALQGRPLANVEARSEADANVDSLSDSTDPRVEAARRSVDVAQARLDQQRSGRIPSLKATAGLQNYGSSTGDYTTEWQAGVRVSWPVFTGGARRAAIHRAEAELAVAQQELRQTELSVSSALDQADAALLEAQARVRALDASVAQWEEVTRIEALSLDTGAGVQQDYLKAEAALFQARAGSARARYDEILAHVGRARAQGRLDRKWIDNALEVR